MGRQLSSAVVLALVLPVLALPLASAGGASAPAARRARGGPPFDPQAAKLEDNQLTYDGHKILLPWRSMSLGAVLGRGAFSIVLSVGVGDAPGEACPGMTLALKVMPPEDAFKEACVANALGALGAPPRALPVLDWRVSGGLGFIVTQGAHMDLGQWLASLKSSGRFFQPNVVKVKFTFFHDIILSIQRMHKAGFVHCDIKPENIVIDKTNLDNFIIDFQFVRQRGHRAKGRDGSKRYMSPQYIKTRICDVDTDMWAAGVILYSMMFDEPPFQIRTSQSDAQHAEGAFGGVFNERTMAFTKAALQRFEFERAFMNGFVATLSAKGRAKSLGEQVIRDFKDWTFPRHSLLEATSRLDSMVRALFSEDATELDNVVNASRDADLVWGDYWRVPWKENAGKADAVTRCKAKVRESANRGVTIRLPDRVDECLTEADKAKPQAQPKKRQSKTGSIKPETLLKKRGPAN